MGMPATGFWTRDAVLALPEDGNRYELVDGELLVSPSPRGVHQAGVAELFRLVDPYVRAHRMGRVCFSPADLDFRSGQLLQPDLFVGARVGSRDPVDWTDYGIPLLVVEVLSPSTEHHDRVTKRRHYQRAGVPVYWIVDLDVRKVEVWRPGDRTSATASRVLSWQPDMRLAPLMIDLPQYFSAVWAE